MPRSSRKPGKNGARNGITTKYDAHNVVLDKTYGAFADLRRELSDSRDDVEKRQDILQKFAFCEDSQKAWLYLEDYFEMLSLSRKDFGDTEWWPRITGSVGVARLEETALLFLRANRPMPGELTNYANFERFAELQEAEKDQQMVHEMERWLLPPAPTHLDAPRAGIRMISHFRPRSDWSKIYDLVIQFSLLRQRTGEKIRQIGEIVDLISRSAHERELFTPDDWEIIEWLGSFYSAKEKGKEVVLNGEYLLKWLARWGATQRLELAEEGGYLKFKGEMASFKPNLEECDGQLCVIYRLIFPDQRQLLPSEVLIIGGQPLMAVRDNSIYFIENPPPYGLIDYWNGQPGIPVHKMSHRLLTSLRQTCRVDGNEWANLCITHMAQPQFVFEMENDTVRLRLQAISERDQSRWQWMGHEWQSTETRSTQNGKPEILDDARLQAASDWLGMLDWFTPEPGLWVGDANENFLNQMAEAWPHRPKEADYMGNLSFQRLFLQPKKLKPRLEMHGSGIDWLSVSAQWEEEGLSLSKADLEQLQKASGRFVKLPDCGWIQLDQAALQEAHETMADLGLEILHSEPQKVSMLHAAQMDAVSLNRLGNPAAVENLKKNIEQFIAVKPSILPDNIQADLRPYQKEGFDFLCHLARLNLGGVLADDMGLGKTLQTLSWLSWLKLTRKKKWRPALVICPASVLHNWRREANRFVPDLKVLILESGQARHNLRKQIPEHDLIVTNYALLRRDLEALQKFKFSAIILDEAQFIKNPGAQITQSVKQLNVGLKLALTGTPLENRLLDLWSIVDFIQPGYLGNQSEFLENYEPRGENIEFIQKIARRRLSARLRPLLMRRLKKQVAKDLPERIEERRDCELTDEQRKLYLAELRRSREQVLRTVQEKGVNKSRIHVLAALTRLRQICCHPRLVGNDSMSGKTETLFELLDPLLAKNQKVLVFSQFVQMLRILENEFRLKNIRSHILTGETKNRQEVVREFQEDENACVFLLSLRAAGTGLNLTNASYVILYDPWWNPAVEAQAIDRTHRIGQTQNVNAYRMIAPGTVEEKIWDLQQRKAQTISDVLGEEGFAKNLNQNDLEYLFSED